MADIFLGVCEEDLPLCRESDSCFFRNDKPIELFPQVYCSSIPLHIEKIQKQEYSQGIYTKGHHFALPLKTRDLAFLLPEGKKLAVTKEWVQAKTRSLSSVILGGGREERSYEDWVVRRMGKEGYQNLYAPYISKRFSSDGSSLSAGLARILHFSSGTPSRFIVQHTLARDASWNQEVQEILLKEEKVYSLRINDRVVPIEGKLKVAYSIPQVLDILPDAPMSIRVDAKYIRYTDKKTCLIEGDFSSFTNQTYFLDAHDPLISMQKISQKMAWVEVCHGVDISARLQQLSAKVLSTSHKRDWTPIWGSQSHFRYRRIACYLESLGIELVGRRALFSHKSNYELAELDLQRNESLSEYLRLQIEPPIRQDDLGASLKKLFA